MINENLNEIYSMGTEAQGIIFKVMASGLNVSIIHCSIFEDTISLDGFDPKDSGEYPVLYISYRTGHYDIFYTRE